MLRDIVAFISILALCCAASLYSDGDGTTTSSPDTCLYQTYTWAAEDPQKYYYCLDNKPVLAQCKKNYYFVLNETFSGCMPAAELNPSCVNLHVTVGPCTGENLKQPQPSQVLTKFWLCESEDAQPVELPCPDGLAFVKQDGYLGCFEWTTWRKLRNCN